MNKVILTGNLARDPEMRYTQSGKAVATFSLAVTRGWKKAENSQYPPSDYFNIIAWDKKAEFCSKYLMKGSRILVEGRLQSRTYEAQDGTKRYVTEVVADEFEFAGAKRQGGNGNDDNFMNDNRPRPSASNSTPPPSSNYNDDMVENRNFDDKDIDMPC